MKSIILGYILTFGWVFVVMGISLLAKRILKAGEEASRKIVHVGVSFAWIPMYLCFGFSIHLAVPPFCFIILNYISVKINLFSMMERSDGEPSYGTVYYALSMTVMAVLSLIDHSFLWPFAAGMFCMAFGDGFAPIFGGIEKGNVKYFKGKRSLYGSLSVFVMSFAVLAVLIFAFNMPLSIPAALIVAVFAAVMEAVGFHGFDNITLPLGVCILSRLLLQS